MSEWPRIVTDWHAAWTSLDAEKITNLYTENAEHMSRVVTDHIGISSGTLKSRAAIRLYAEAAVKHLTSFHADIINVIADCDGDNGRAAVEYWRTFNGENEKRSRVFEFFEWRDDKLTSCRVYHF